MTDEQVKAIVEELTALPDSDKQFMLGYAAGVSAAMSRKGETE